MTVPKLTAEEGRGLVPDEKNIEPNIACYGPKQFFMALLIALGMLLLSFPSSYGLLKMTRQIK